MIELTKLKISINIFERRWLDAKQEKLVSAISLLPRNNLTAPKMAAIERWNRAETLVPF